jgi:hypothetical protein
MAAGTVVVPSFRKPCESNRTKAAAVVIDPPVGGVGKLRMTSSAPSLTPTSSLESVKTSQPFGQFALVPHSVLGSVPGLSAAFFGQIATGMPRPTASVRARVKALTTP